jgi:ATP-dependent DNA ligase
MPIPGTVFPPFGCYALASFPPNPNPFQAARLHLALPARSCRPSAVAHGWLHEIKFDGYRIIARKDGERVCLWARTTSDYSSAFTRIREAVVALPVDNAVLDGEAVLMRSDDTFDFEGPALS